MTLTLGIIVYLMIGFIMVGYTYEQIKDDDPFEIFLLCTGALFLWPIMLLILLGKYIRKVKEGK